MQRPPSRAQFQAGQQPLGQRPPSRTQLQPQQQQQQQQHPQQAFGVSGMMNGYGAKPNQHQPGQLGQTFVGVPSVPGSLQQFQMPFSQQQQQLSQQGSQQLQQMGTGVFVGQVGSPSPTATVPGSPFRGSKRKLGVEASPRLGAGFQMGSAMGPPAVLPKSMQPEGLAHVNQVPGMGNAVMNSISGVNQSMNMTSGVFPRPSSQTSRPGSAIGTSSIHNMMDDVNMSPGATGIPSSGSGNIDTTGAPALNMSLSAGLDMTPSGRGSQPPQQLQAPQSVRLSHQRQTSLPPQFPAVSSQGQTSNLPLVQQHMRQGSMPPPVGIINSTPVKNELRTSVPPSSTGSISAPPIPPSIAGAPPVGSTSTPMPVTAASAVNQAPSLPPGVNPAITHVTFVPLSDSVRNIPDLTEDDIKNVQLWMKMDKEYEGAWRKMKERMAEEVRDVFGPRNAPWWERGSLDVNINRWKKARESFDIRYPRKPKDGSQRRKGARREGFKLPQRLNPEDVNKPEQLVPIRLEFDVEHHKMRDTFVWNLNDPLITPEHFAQTLVEDYNLSSSYHTIITKSIQDQLSDFKAHSVNYETDEGGAAIVYMDGISEEDVMRGRLDDENGVWWELWRRSLRAEYLKVSKHGTAGRARKKRKAISDGMVVESQRLKEKPMAIDEFELDEQALHEDMRILIKLDIIVGSMKLDDQFEWDLDNPNASPEEFAEIYAQDLGLGGEFKTAMAHCIREQVQAYQKSLFLVGHPSDGSAVQDEDLRLSFLPTLTSGARSTDQIQSFTPLLNYLSDGEIERSEKEREKDMTKRRKRNTRGRRGITLPDREPIRTYRTPAIGFPELDPATIALAATANVPSRRAAAAAASLTIANMVASENGVPFMPQPLPSAPQLPQPQMPKEKKTKGFFKAPSYPQTVLRPRAQVAAPTLSTAADVSKLPAPLENDPPPVIPALPDNKIAKVITAKRAKELEREAKEKEYVDGQHPNYIDGVWHCSNCGCPESIAIGRRKGPLGDKSQCGTCGKYWHRHRRPRPVEYTSDPDFHSGLRREAELVKSASKKKGAAAALRAQSMALSMTPADASEPQTPSRLNGDVEMSSRRQSPLPPVPRLEDDRAISPVSTVSSASEPPLSQKVKINGTNHAKPSTPTPSATVMPVTPAPSAQDPNSSKTVPQPARTPPSSPTKAWVSSH
ncbi:hypothetical protein AX17_001667 [Amanita inopinata Kibby_2008]|nr:hypothetical protein AX17_001667 [Amanita inopinata Kibby_2008]